MVAYVKPDDGKIKILEGYKPTIAECKATDDGSRKIVPGAMAWVCYDLRSFEQ